MPRGRRPSDSTTKDRRLRTVPSQRDAAHARRSELQEESIVGKLAPLRAEDVLPPEGMPQGRIKHYRHAVEWVLQNENAVISDRMAVMELGRTWADLQQVAFLLEQDGVSQSIEDRYGNTRYIAHPLLSERNRLRNALKGLLREFGLTPDSRRTMTQADPEKEVDEEDAAWAALIKSQPAG